MNYINLLVGDLQSLELMSRQTRAMLKHIDLRDIGQNNALGENIEGLVSNAKHAKMMYSYISSMSEPGYFSAKERQSIASDSSEKNRGR